MTWKTYYLSFNNKEEYEKIVTDLWGEELDSSVRTVYVVGNLENSDKFFVNIRLRGNLPKIIIPYKIPEPEFPKFTWF